MNSRASATTFLTVLAITLSAAASALEHPSLGLTGAGVANIRASLGAVPLFDETLAAVKKEVDAEIALGIDVPIPKDFSGGYTHERHKLNFFILQKAGALFQILEDEKYAIYIRDMLFQYEAMYKDLPLHPQERSYARGKLFWQCLNDSNWLLYVSQAYDSVYNWLDESERQTLESNLFRPFADFISIENPQFFNRVHNHSTWGSAAVGMIGLVMGDEELVQRALYGVKDASLNVAEKDDDGGLIAEAGQRAGFLANLDEPFSPDGYYTEGPYYQRYAMSPFLVFSQALENSRPDLDIRRHKDGVLLKAVGALLNLTDSDGEFFPFNDAQKGMSYLSRELVSAVDIAYHLGDQDPRLLSIAEAQGRVTLDDAGFAVALAVSDGQSRPFNKASVNLRDGTDGDEGGVAVLRSGDVELVFKYAAQGLSHGHYDKLSISMYERGNEVLQDYGLVRFVNIEQKGGGNYLPENTTWAKQTIAHNTLTLDERSHFQGIYEVGRRHHSQLHFFDASDPRVQIASAVEMNAYPGVSMRRTVALVSTSVFERPILLDVFKVVGDRPRQHDLPFYFHGQPIDVGFDFETETTLNPLGSQHGYQHLYLEGVGIAGGDNTAFTWLNAGRFFTLTTATEKNDQLLFTRIGANDANFNLRRDAGFMIRRDASEETVFVAALESHGSYSPVSEQTLRSTTSVDDLRIVHDDPEYTAVSVSDGGNMSNLLIIAEDGSMSRRHTLVVGGRTFRWIGPYHLAESERADR
ncbi:MAG: alginate lyase family protein [Pseudomonadota bacterium]